MEYVTEKMKEKAEVETPVVVEPELNARDLSQELSGSINARMEEDRSIILTMKHGERPEVDFNGFWNGRLVKNAMNAISRGYRLRRHKQVRAHADVPNKEE